MAILHNWATGDNEVWEPDQTAMDEKRAEELDFEAEQEALFLAGEVDAAKRFWA